jgi:hypothetical protein
MCRIDDVMRHHYVRSQDGDRLSDIYFQHLEGPYCTESNFSHDDGNEEGDYIADAPEEEENRTFLALIELRYAQTLSGAIDQEHSQMYSH